MTRLLIYRPTYLRLRDRLHAADPGLQPILFDDDNRLEFDGRDVTAETAGADVALANGEVFFGPAARGFSIAMLKSPGLKWVQSAAAGYDHPMFRQLVGKGLMLTTSHGQAVGMADFVLAGVLDHFCGGSERRAAQAAGEWRRLTFREIEGSTWLVVGFGAIGQGVARRARSFGARIVGVRRDPSPHPLADRITPLTEVPQALGDADVVVLCVPLSSDTRHLANEAFFKAMKPGAVLVNVGRGGLVDEAALLAGLDRGAPGHALLDVFETEPLPPDSAFWRHPRVSISAHSSGATEGQHARNDALFLDNLSRFSRGEPLLNLAAAKDVLAAQA